MQHGFRDQHGLKCNLGDPSLIRKKGTISKIILHAENLSVFIFTFVYFISLSLYFSRKLSPVSMASRPPTIGKTICFGLGRCDQDATIKVHESSQLTTRCKKNDNHVPVTPLIGSEPPVMSVQWLPYGKIISANTSK